VVTYPCFWFLLQQFRPLPKASYGEGVDSGTVFKSVCINTAIYLPWLVSQCLKNGVRFRRRVFEHISDASADPTLLSLFRRASSSAASAGKKIHVVVNCTGLMASKLGGVEDKTVVPARGQIVLVRNEADRMVNISGTDDGDDEVCYVMTRAAGGGTVLGGCYQKGNWDAKVDEALAKRIMQRAVKLCPSLTGGKGGIEHLDVVRHGVGLRPVREGGTRIEREKRGDVWVVHNYGAGGAGYQSSYGCAEEAVSLIAAVDKLMAKL
jgi:D-amino-acid oxidase